MRDKILTYIGFATRARQIVYGKERIRDYIKSPRRYKVLVIAKDASERLKRDLMVRCKKRKVPYIVDFSKDDLGRILGKKEVSAVGIENDDLVKAILNVAGLERGE